MIKVFEISHIVNVVDQLHLSPHPVIVSAVLISIGIDAAKIEKNSEELL